MSALYPSANRGFSQSRYMILARCVDPLDIIE
jgi:hypothetical protein